MNWTEHQRHRALILTVTALALAGFAAPAANAAEGERVLEPRLSLIGGCKEEALDPVEDPGCPNNPLPSGHPPATFSDPRAVATDLHGNIYVSNFGSAFNGSKGRVDVFCSDGTFISELAVAGATSVAIDSEGNLYVYSPSQGKVLLFAPDAGYQPKACEIEYAPAPAPVSGTEFGSLEVGLAINQDNDHLFADFGSPGVIEYSSAAEGNEVIRKSPGPSWSGGTGMAVDAARDRMYASAGPSEERIDIFDLNSPAGPPPAQYEKVGSILPSSVPAGDFGTGLSIAVDEGNGNVFVLDGENCQLYEFDEDGDYLQTIAADFLQCIPGLEIGVDNGPTSPNGKLSEEAGEGRFLYVPSHRTGTGHSFAFFISTVGPPEMKSTAATDISEEEAILRAQIDPNNLETTYALEYKVEGAADWTPAGEGTLPAGNADLEVSAPATGLSPGASYSFRAVATNEEGTDEAQGSFATYPSVDTEPSPCPNALLRSGASALLPDCRAYELVSPPDTNARAPLGVSRQGAFTTREVSPAGDKVPFRVEGGSIPGFGGGTGSVLGDPYLATRTPTGWSTTYTGPSASEATDLAPGATSPDQGYFSWMANGKGSAVLGGETAYVRYPDGHSELLGQGSLGIDPKAAARLISEGGGHIIFMTGVSGSAVQLEPEAAPNGTKAIYDRTPDGTTHVVSLKPGDIPFGASEVALYQGNSLDGLGIAFEVGGTLYLRYDNEETFAIGSGVDSAGVAEGGNQIFYVEGGDLLRFDALAPEGERVTEFAGSGDAVPVTVSAEGSTAYFVSETVLGATNPLGDSAQAGGQNLYRSLEGQIEFLGTVTERDVEGAKIGSQFSDGLGLWADAAVLGDLGRVPARATPDGSAFLFKSRAALTDYDPEGKAQIYRYDSDDAELQCLSCNPTGAAAGSDASLQSEFREGAADPSSLFAWPENLRADGRRAFFESSERLVARDADGRQDVYEWEDEGVGSCTQPEGCLYLISSPHSARDEYLWAVSESGNDAFFSSNDLLLPADVDGTGSIYDARVGGGFAEAQVRAECLGEACQPSVSPPNDPTPGLAGSGGNVKKKPKARRCAKGKRKVRRAGKVRCLKRKSQRKQAKHRAAAKRKGGRR